MNLSVVVLVLCVAIAGVALVVSPDVGSALTNNSSNSNSDNDNIPAHSALNTNAVGTEPVVEVVGEDDVIRTTADGRPRLLVRNAYGALIHVYWSESRSMEHLVAELKPGEDTTVDSHNGHVFIARDPALDNLAVRTGVAGRIGTMNVTPVSEEEIKVLQAKVRAEKTGINVDGFRKWHNLYTTPLTNVHDATPEIVKGDSVPDAASLSSVHVFIQRNGGNHTSDCVTWEVDVPVHASYAFIESHVLQHAPERLSLPKLPLYDASLLYLTDSIGRIVTSSEQLINDEVYLVLAEHERFFYPGGNKGDVRVLHDIPSGQDPSKPLSMHTIALQPRLFYIPGFLSDWEADGIIAVGKNSITPSGVQLDDKLNQTDAGRKSQHAWIWRTDPSEAVASATRRVHELARLPPQDEVDEPLQVLRYLPGEFYNCHLDAFDPPRYKNQPRVQMGCNRMATVYFYLNCADEGGETAFCRLTPDAELKASPSWESGWKTDPRKGDAIFWYNLEMDGHNEGIDRVKVDPLSMHAAVPVKKGIKWGSNKWLHNRRCPGADGQSLP